MTTKPEQPATMAELLHRIAYGMEILPEPPSFERGRVYGEPQADIYLHLDTAAAFEQWRQWVGAPAAEVGQWKPTGLSSGGATRRHTTTGDWRGRSIRLLHIEYRHESLTREERRQQLAAELAKLDEDMAGVTV